MRPNPLSRRESENDKRDPVSRPAPATPKTGNLRVAVVPGAHLLPETAPALVAAAFEHFG